jgi:hypothetical protein
MSEVFMGIIEGLSPEAVTVGLIDEENGLVSGSTFSVEKVPLHDYYPPPRDSEDAVLLPSDLSELGRFLHENVPNDSKLHALAEAPVVVPQTGTETDIPYAILPIDSAVLKVIAGLALMGYIALEFIPNEEMTRVVLFPLLTNSDMEQFSPIVPKYLRNGICKAYGELLFDECSRPEDIAIVGALIARNPGAYHYWSSIGQVQSSQDVLFYLRTGQVQPTSVISAEEKYTIEVTDATVRDEIEDLPLEYALTEREYAHLGPNDTIKAALIRICKRWHIVLRCSSNRGDADDPEGSYLVQPLGESDSIVAAALEPVAPPKYDSDLWPEIGE